MIRSTAAAARKNERYHQLAVLYFCFIRVHYLADSGSLIRMIQLLRYHYSIRTRKELGTSHGLGSGPRKEVLY